MPTGLGILRAGHRKTEGTSRVLSSDIRRQSRSRDLSLVTKANSLSTVHRAGYLDYVGIKQFDPKGRLIGERRFLGLWTSAAYNSNPREIPLLRQKIAQVAEHFALPPDSHDGKALQHILESFPRDELFQASVPELTRIVTGIFGLQERPRVRVLLRRDLFHRFYSCLVFVPREKYNTQVRQRIERVIRRSILRGQHGIPGADRRIESRPHPHRRANLARRERACRFRRAGAPRRRGGAFVAGFLQGRPARPLRRSLRTAAVRQVCPGLSRRLHRRFPGRRRGARCLLPRIDGEGTCTPALGHLQAGSEAQG